jgi:excisionase family DNA binding protein
MDLLTVKEAADLLKLSLGAVYALCKAGTLPHHRLGKGGGAIRIDRQDLLTYVEQCKAGAAPVARGGSSSPVPESPAPRNSLPVGGFTHLRLDRLLGGQPPADGPTSDRDGRNGR